METEVKCPSGLRGRVRAIKVKDEKVFTDAKLLKSGKLTQEVCKRCWLETLDPGPYDFQDGVVNWEKVLQGDAFHLFFQLRRLSYGNEYDFPVQCGNCYNTIRWKIDLDEDLRVKELPKESKEAMMSNNPLETKLDDGRIVQFRLLLLEDERKVSNLEKSRQLSRKHASIAARLISVENIESTGNQHFDLVRFVEELDAGEADLLQENMEALDCGIDTSIEIVCGNCLYSEVVDLPFDPSFFRRKKKEIQKEM